MWKILMKDVDVGEPTSFFDHVSLGCMGAKEKLPCSGKSDANISSWSCDAMKLEDRSQEETERQERCGREDPWRLAKNILKL